MTSQEPITNSAECGGQQCQDPAQPISDAASGPRGTVDLQRWAQLIADGEIPFPNGLDSGDEVRLAQNVAHRRRLRLVRFIARQIALQIQRSAGPIPLENSHDQKQLQPE